MDPILFGRSPNEEQINSYEQRMVAALKLLDTKWLGRGADFIAGNKITIADLIAACELEQPSKFEVLYHIFLFCHAMKVGKVVHVCIILETNLPSIHNRD